MWTKKFWKDAAERVFFTFLAALGTGISGIELVGLDTKQAVYTVLVTAVLTTIKVLAAGAKDADTVSPASLVKD